MLALVTAAVAAVATRLAYPILLERRHGRLRPTGPDGIIRGAEAITLFRKDAPGALLLHGGGDTPQVLAGLAQYLFSRGFSVRVPLLSGHGRALSALWTGSAQQWHDEARQELDALRMTHDTVFVVGLSLGGALAVDLVADGPGTAAVVLLAPYLEMPRFALSVADRAGVWRLLLPYFPSGGADSIRDRAAAARSLGHGLLTPALLREFRDVVKDANESLPLLRVPTLVIHSRGDNRISIGAAERGFAKLGSAEKRLEWIDGAAHVITVDFGHDRVFRLTGDWLSEHRP